MLPDLDLPDEDLLDEGVGEDDTDEFEDEDEDEDEDDDEEPDDPITRDRVLHALGVLGPSPTRVREWVDDETRVAGMDVHPGGEQLHHYWTRDPRGLRKWALSPHPWTSLYHHLRKYVGTERAKRMAAEWFHEHFGYWPGSDIHRVRSGKPPRGKLVGPG